MEPSSLLLAAAAVVAAVFLYFRHRFSYWARRGVPFHAPKPVVGNFGDVLLGRKNVPGLLADLSRAFREVGYCGIYSFDKPVLLVWDPEMVRQIVAKDFSSFHDRGQPFDPADPLSQTLFALGGKQWKNLRSKLTPAFTSGKLKAMLPLMRDVGADLVDQVALEAHGGCEVDMEELLSRFVTDVVGTVAFGIKCNCLRDPNSDFRAMSKKLFKQTPASVARILLTTVHPKLGVLLPFKWFFAETNDFFLNLMRDQVDQREKTSVERNDFVQQMMQLRAADLADVDPDNHLKVTTGVMAAQAFIFFLAGLDNISNTLGYILTRLAGDQDLQDRLASEVRRELQQHGGELSYEALKKMSLVSRVALEGLRLWNPLGVVFRKCNATTRVGDVVVEKGQMLFIATNVINMDESVFPEPQRFDPERHTAEEKAKRHPYAFLPFGEGPRICIAERFALLEMELTIAVLVDKLRFSPGPNYEKEVEIDTRAPLPKPKNGFHLQVTERI
ncbi:Cytochrome P450 CYP6 [Frankliniella occidentalis]|uniref:Cytochrome P450 6a2-like n=1 Tax=Frankliniella occidentalis TaxID=133901 RepID=A0A6J1SAC9_FRAOC|nr:cytochrome P450 6a2-like [Frankliniella occidentalis]KAE8752909.1 Cytochrome P450 CYP6 [Frankliniella occidentalis]